MKAKIIGILADASAFLTILAALPYELGPVAEMLPPEWKKYVASIGIFATLGLRLIKRAQTPPPLVEGEPQSVQDPILAPAPHGTCKRPPAGWYCSREEGHEGPCAAWPETGTILRVIAFALLLPLAGCSTTGTDPKQNARARATNQALAEAASILGRAATQALFNVAAQEMGGGKVDFGQAAAAGLWANVSAVDTAHSIGRIVKAWGGDELPVTADRAKAISAAALSDGQSPATVASSVAAVIATAAGTPPAR